jgi:hypothetical protein
MNYQLSEIGQDSTNQWDLIRHLLEAIDNLDE